MVGLTILGSSALMSCTTPKKANLSRTFSDSTMVMYIGNDTDFAFLLTGASQPYMTISINMNDEILAYWGDEGHRVTHIGISIDELKQHILKRFKEGDIPKENELFHVRFDRSTSISKISALKDMLLEIGINRCEVSAILNYDTFDIEIKALPTVPAVTYDMFITTKEGTEIKGVPIIGVSEEFIDITDDVVRDSKEAESDEIFFYTEVEQKPEFPDGMAELAEYIQENIKYPAYCMKEGIQGRVIVQFIVNEDGSISEAEVINPVNPLLDSEALRLVYTMPNWIPGKQMGKPVRVRFYLPVTFRLSDESTTPK